MSLKHILNYILTVSDSFGFWRFEVIFGVETNGSITPPRGKSTSNCDIFIELDLKKEMGKIMRGHVFFVWVISVFCVNLKM
jgi:hypothetical protein